MNLNIGSGCPQGQYLNSDWINVEYCKELKLKDKRVICADAKSLPFKNDSFKLIHCIHMLEHVDRQDHHSLLKEMYRVLESNGKAFIEVPDFVKICDMITNLHKLSLTEEIKEAIRIWTLSVYGKGRYNGDTHRWGFYKELLKDQMESAGFKVSFPKEPISTHYKQEPVLLACGIKL